MHTVQFIRHIVENNHLLAYLIVFLVTIFEGEVISIAAGIMVLLGALNFWICLILILAGGMIKTFCGYFLGAFLQRKFNNRRFFQYMEKRISAVLPNFNKNPFWSIFFSKFMVGINHVVILFAGYQKINFRTYFKAEFLATIIWAPLLLLAGYFFSFTALHITKRVSEFFLVIILCVIGLFLLDKLITLVYDVFENLNNDNENKQ